MTTFTVKLNNSTISWNEAEVQQKLERIGHADKKVGWITEYLNVESSSKIGRIFWTYVGKYFQFLRHFFYGVDLEKSKSILTQLRPQISDPLRDVFDRALAKFETIAPRHRLEKWSRPIQHPPQNPTKSRSVAELMEHYDRSWDPVTAQFHKSAPFDIERVELLMRKFIETMGTPHDASVCVGFIEKIDFPRETRIFVRADLHGDLKSPLENLKTLRKQGLLDENYRCKADVHLLFLGDYLDRGLYCLQLLELLMTLKLQDPEQVTLLRGNHEHIQINRDYESDPVFKAFSDRYGHVLKEFYETLPLTICISEINPEGKRHYVHFTHGMFPLSQDPSELLQSTDDHVFQFVPKKSKASERVHNLLSKPLEEPPSTDAKAVRKYEKRCRDIERFAELFVENRERKDVRPTLCLYNWGDVQKGNDQAVTKLGDPSSRDWKISPTDVKVCLRIFAVEHPIKVVFRGHEHELRHHTLKGKVVVTTLPVGMESKYAELFPNQLDTAYVLTTGRSIDKWTKQAYLRKPGQSEVVVTKHYPIRSTEI